MLLLQLSEGHLQLLNQHSLFESTREAKETREEKEIRQTFKNKPRKYHVGEEAEVKAAF